MALVKTDVSRKTLEQGEVGVRRVFRYYGIPQSARALNKISKSRNFRRSDYAHQKYLLTL